MMTYRINTCLSLVLLVSLLTVMTVSAQTCMNPNDIFLKNDNLPTVPAGPQTFSIIPGLCEGEAIGAVFDVSGIGSIVQLNMAAVLYANAGGANGIQAGANLKIYDGITWAGGVPILGTQVLDWVNSTGSNIGVTSSNINTIDLSTNNVTISSGTMVVTWWMDFNPLGGTCASGYQTNFATDNTGLSFSCNSPLQKNLVYIQGQGWRDVRTANVGGFLLCPIFINGNWVIRACVADVTPTNPLNINFFPSSTILSGGLALVQFQATPADANKFYIPMISCTPALSPIPGTSLMAPALIDTCSLYYLNDPGAAQVFSLTPSGLFGTLGANGDASGTVNIPGGLNLPPGGLPLHFFFVLVNGTAIEAVSNLATLTIQ